MSNSFNVDIAVECLRNIVDSNRCVICDKLEGNRLRYNCGHAICDDCVDGTGECLLCLTPPVKSTASQPARDDPLTQRAKNAAQLLEASQEAFKVDVYRRQKLSEQLKTEKELFPECIQAPHKYFNKRKSLIGSLKNKENKHRSSYPGEQISPYKGSNMEKSTYIKQWIKQNESALTKSSRKPFADLNLNCQQFSPRHITTPIKKRVDIMLDKVHDNSENTRKLRSRKRSHFKTTLSLVNSQSKLDKYLKQDTSEEGSKRFKGNLVEPEKSTLKKFNKHDKDESGIVADIEPIIIEDSQSEVVDKDKQAWLAVLEAEKSERSDSATSVRLECSEIINFTDDVEKTLHVPTEFSILKESTVYNKVPFYKKSYLLEKCKQCVDGNKSQRNHTETDSKDVSITIESNSFVTTIKVSNNSHSHIKVVDKHSIPVQTDINGIAELNNKVSQNPNIELKKHFSNIVLEEPPVSANIGHYLQSQDLFTGEAKTLQGQKSVELSGKDSEVHNIVSHEASNVIVSETDSDGEVDQSSIMQVKAEVHRSSDQLEYGVLTELDENDLQLRTIHSNRGTTPGSTDSSEKENYDPNRQKRMKLSKKDVKKNREK